MNRYDESVYAARWMLILVALAAIASAGGAVAALPGDDGPRWGAAALLVSIGAVLGVIEFMFMRLRIELSGECLRFHFGPFGPTLKLADIQSAEPAPYRWLRFGGWGIRVGHVSGRSIRAYSVPFLRTGVALETVTGTRYYVSSQRPAAFATAILVARTQEGPA